MTSTSVLCRRYLAVSPTQTWWINHLNLNFVLSCRNEGLDGTEFPPAKGILIWDQIWLYLATPILPTKCSHLSTVRLLTSSRTPKIRASSLSPTLQSTVNCLMLSNHVSSKFGSFPKLNPFYPLLTLKKVIHAPISSHLDYSHFRLKQQTISSLQLIQNAAL